MTPSHGSFHQDGQRYSSYDDHQGYVRTSGQITGQGYERDYGQNYGHGHGPQRYQPKGYVHSYAPPESARNRIDAARLWAGGAIVALVAALASAVALLLVRGVLNVPVFAPERQGTMVLATTGSLALGAAATALLGTAVLHLLLLATPQPGRFLAWIVTLATAAVMLLPFTSYASWEAKFGTAGVYFVIGIVVGTLLTTVGRSASPDR